MVVSRLPGAAAVEDPDRAHDLSRLDRRRVPGVYRASGQAARAGRRRVRGRFLDVQYGAFKNANYLFPGATGLDVLDPGHHIFVGLNPDAVGSMFIHAGRQALTVGGNNNAAGVNGVLLSNWKDGTSGVGIKELLNGKRTAHFGAFANPIGTSTGKLLRNLVGWVAGGIP